MVLSLFQAGEANALSCEEPEVSIFEHLLPQDKVLRLRSLSLAEILKNKRDGEVMVLGRFYNKVKLPFLHEEQIEAIRAQYWPPSENVQMPDHIEYTYSGAYRFEGHQFIDGEFIPLVAEEVDARFSISILYYGIVDLLPPTEIDVVGALRLTKGVNIYEVTTSVCPTYEQVEPAQMADLLQCFADGECL
ncbi:hypothetical protein [Ruegeria halocynthiae]|uniref:hypothetical protein n=1 Tax=Ruegeria halocynthiae TaxID=985054 RepID=UPI0005653689|nr:hypothetical protein [Ruegeria halocynthiae]